MMESPSSPEETNRPDEVELTITYNKEIHVVSMPLSSTILQLKERIYDMIHVPIFSQKILIKGLAKDDQTLESLNVSSSSKIMVVGAKLPEVLSVRMSVYEESSAASSSSQVREPLCKKKLHMQVLKYGKPINAMVGTLGLEDSLPEIPLSGMLNKRKMNVRLLFKLEIDQLWISTKSQTEKIALCTIGNIVSEPIEDHPEYHIMGLKLGTTEASRYWIYWVPAQYIRAIKNVIKKGKRRD